VNAWKKLDVKDALTGAVVQLRQMDIATLAKLADLEGYSGRLDGRVVVEQGASSMTWDLTAKNVVTPQVRNVELDSHGDWDKDALAAKAAVRIQGQNVVGVDAKVEKSLAALLSGNLGDVRATPITVDATTKDLDLQALKGAFKQKIRLAGKLDLDAHAEGTLGDPKGKAKLSLKEGRIAKVEFASLDINGTLDSARIQGTVNAKQKVGGTLDVTASIDRKAHNAVGAQIQAKAFDLGFIPALARSETDALAGVGGKLDADIKASVDANGRQATGTIALNQGTFYVPSSGLVSDVVLRATLQTGKLDVTQITGKSGTGSLDGKAQAGMNGLIPTSINLDLNLHDLPVTAGAQVLQLSTQANLTGKSLSGPTEWDMTLTLHQTNVRMPKSKRGGGTLQSTGKLDDVVFVDTPDFAQRQALLVMTGQEELEEGSQLSLTMKIDAQGGVNITGQELSILMKPDLTVKIREGATLVGGSVEVDHGYVELFGRRWDIDRANASFDESNPPNPRIDVELEHAFQTTTVYIDVTGSLSKPKLDFRADPGTYEQSQILGFVLGGDPDQPSNSDQQPLQDRAVGVASGVLLGQVQSQLRDVLPIDVLNVSVGDAESTTTTRVEVGKWLSDRLFIGYQARMNAPDDENVNEAEMKFRLGRRWLLDAFYGDRSVGGADVIWSKKY
jgi:translocation and assembly module TamB